MSQPNQVEHTAADNEENVEAAKVSLLTSCTNGDVDTATSLLDVYPQAVSEWTYSYNVDEWNELHSLLPLHVASSAGHLNIVKLLLQRNAPREARDECGWTALHYAAKHVRVDVVVCLLKFGCNCNSRTLMKETALHLATISGSVMVVKQLVAWPGCNTDIRDAAGYTALHHACHHFYHDILVELVDSACQLDKQALNGWTALHLAAFRRNRSAVDTLLKAGALAILRTPADQFPSDIAASVGDSSSADKLKKAESSQRHCQESLGVCLADTIVVYVLGPPSVGKTTLIQSLRVARFSGLSWGDDTFAKNPPSGKTHGLQLYAWGDFEFFYQVVDCGGRNRFDVSYQLTVINSRAPTLAIFVFSWQGIRGDSEFEQNLLHWCSVFASSTSRSKRLSRQPIIIVINSLGSIPMVHLEKIEKAVKRVASDFAHCFSVMREVVVINSAKPHSVKMSFLRGAIAEAAHELLKTAVPQPCLCRDIQRSLIRLRQHAHSPIVSAKELPAQLARVSKGSRNDYRSAVITQSIPTALIFLGYWFEVIKTKCPRFLGDQIIIDPSSFLQDLMMKLFGGDSHTTQIQFSNGCASRREVENILERANIKGHKVLQVVCGLGLCVLDNDDVICPATVTQPFKGEDWGLMDSSPSVTLIGGSRLLCIKNVPLSPACLCQLQVKLCCVFDKNRPILRSDAIKVSAYNGKVEGLVRLHRGNMAIDVILWGHRNVALSCHVLQRQLLQQLQQTITRYSPGTRYSRRLLSSQELHQLAMRRSASIPTTTYTRDAVLFALDRRQHVHSREGGFREEPQDLLLLPEAHISRMPQRTREAFCQELDLPCESSRPLNWTGLAYRLRDIQKIIPYLEELPSPTDGLLQRWARLPDSTVDQLIQVVEKLPHPKAAAILRGRTNEKAVTA